MTENKGGSILIKYSRKADKDFVNSLLKETEVKDNEDDDIVHLFQCLEECTDINYRPPQLFLEQIINFKLGVYSYETNGYYYTFSSSVLDFYGKGKTLEYSRNDLMSFVTKSIRCGNSGIYPKCSSLEFECTYCESLFKKISEDDKDDSKDPMNDSIHQEINNDGSINFIFDKENMSARAFRKLLERLVKCESKMCTLLNYNEWVKNGCPVYKFDDSYCISLENGNISLDTNIDDTNVEKVSFLYCDVSNDKLRSMIESKSKSV